MSTTNDSPPPEQRFPPSPDVFPIVGIGASAGGLEALDQFLSPIPADCGMAFVIIQHLDPTHKGVMPELLQRNSKLIIEQAREGVQVQPNHAYVIPPNTDLSILHRTLHLFDPVSPRGLRLPIDFFFRMLAEDQQERSVGVILSGMGSDGTLGLRAIKERAGLALVQEPASAKFDAMPRSAIAAGLADVVAPAEALYARLMAYFEHTPPIAPLNLTQDDQNRSGLDQIVILLRAHNGHDFSQYKNSTLYRRIERRMGLHRLNRIAHYVRYLQENPQEVDLLFKELLIGVTRFFRDPAAWKQVQDQVIPVLLANYSGGGPLRVWVAGCSTGEEAYSLAILLKEALDQLSPAQPVSLQIFATDLDRDAIAEARNGIYLENIAGDVSPDRLQRFFVKEASGYRISPAIREMVTFAPQNVIMDPPFTKLALLICRNLLIYLTAELQTKLLSVFHFSLNPSGFLFLGSAETIGASSDLFESIPGPWRLYRRKTFGAQLKSMDFSPRFALNAESMASAVAVDKPAAANLQTLADRILLQQFSPAAVLTNAQGDIFYISGRTGKYLEPAAGQVNWNLFAMARAGLDHELPGIFQAALHQASPEAIIRRGLQVKTNGHYQTVNLAVQVLQEPEALYGMVMVVFTDVVIPRRAKKRSNAASATLDSETQQLREALQATREEMQTSQEELKSANEELQSTNEELQSTNEELTTSKEEMQSLNEELQTVNAELQAKVMELMQASNDMKNLLNSTEIATLFLDDALHIRRFTTQTTKLIKLIASDVGRPITDIASNLIYPALAVDVAEVLRTLVVVEKTLAMQDGRWFTVQIKPYRTLDNWINGVVVTLIDTTAFKQLERELAEVRAERDLLRAQKPEKPNLPAADDAASDHP